MNTISKTIVTAIIAYGLSITLFHGAVFAAETSNQSYIAQIVGVAARYYPRRTRAYLRETEKIESLCRTIGTSGFSPRTRDANIFEVRLRSLRDHLSYVRNNIERTISNVALIQLYPGLISKASAYIDLISYKIEQRDYAQCASLTSTVNQAARRGLK